MTEIHQEFMRWPLELSMYDMDVKYIKGETNVEADALSHSPVIKLLNINDIKQAQLKISD